MPSKKQLLLLSRIKSGLLTDSDIKLVVARMHSVLSPDVLALMKEFGVDPDITIRLSTFGSKCRQRREELGWDLKCAAEKVGVPRYRIDAIESGSKSSCSQKEVERYVAALGVNDWFEKWKRMNRRAFKSLPLEPDRPTAWAKKVRGTSSNTPSNGAGRKSQS